MSDEAQQPIAATLPELHSGMIVRVHEKIQDVNAKGEARERVQIFEGLVLGVRGAGASKTFTVRKESKGYGVEKIYPVSSPNVTKVEVVKIYKTRRAKLSFIKGFARKFKEMMSGK